jgi:sensor histidine kinase YesM
MQAQLADARLDALRMQINPHFLFNTLNTISSYLEQDPRGVRRMIARLSDLLRYTLEGTNAREVPLRQELGFIDSYLALQQIRFEERLKIDRDIDPDVLDALVPNLILQPLVENALKYGIDGREEGGRIELSVWRQGNYLHLCVGDDGPGLPPPGDTEVKDSQGIGLHNTRERLASLYGSDQQFNLESSDGGGLIAHVVLPYHTSTDFYIPALSQ